MLSFFSSNKDQSDKPLHIIGLILACLYALLAASALITGYKLFQIQAFTSDGFHYYSSIRNFYQYGDFWEGPTFEYTLGNHSYVTLYLLGIPCLLFKSPAVLAMLNAAAIFFAGGLLMIIGKKLVKGRYSEIISILLGFLYILYPFVAECYFAKNYMLQPDFLTHPLLLLMFLFALNEKLIPFLLTSAFLLLTKEEYIVLFPVFVFFILHLKYLMTKRWLVGSQPSQKKFTILLLSVYVLCSATSIALLFCFRELNDLNHAVKTTIHWEGFSISRMTYLLQKLLKDHMYVLLPIVLLFGYSIKDKRIFVLLFYFFSFTIGRIVLNYLIYGSFKGTIWGNAILPPTQFLTIVCLFGIVSELLGPKKFMQYSVSLLSIALFLSLNNSANKSGLSSISKLFTAKLIPEIAMEEFSSINKMLPPARQRSYFITEEYLMGPFMERSHVVINWTKKIPAAKKRKILAQSDFILLKKTSPYVVEFSNGSSYQKIAETKSLVCFQYKNSKN